MIGTYDILIGDVIIKDGSRFRVLADIGPRRSTRRVLKTEYLGPSGNRAKYSIPRRNKWIMKGYPSDMWRVEYEGLANRVSEKA